MKYIYDLLGAIVCISASVSLIIDGPKASPDTAPILIILGTLVFEINQNYQRR